MIRPPSEGEDPQAWSQKVNSNDPGVIHEVHGLGTLGNVPINKILQPGPGPGPSDRSYQILSGAFHPATVTLTAMCLTCARSTFRQCPSSL